MDLSTLKPVERIVSILHPATGVEIGVNVTLVSLTDDSMKRIKRNIQNEKLRLEQRGKSFKADDMEENGKTLLFSAMKGWEWSNGATFNGSVPTFNQANVFKVLDELPWFRQQLEEAVSDEAAFFQISEVDSKKPAVSTLATKQ